MSAKKKESEPVTPESALRSLIEATVERPVSNRARCARYHQSVNAYLARVCSSKVNQMKPIDGNPSCPCDRDPAKSGVDLVVLVDASGSMGGTWTALAEAAAGAIEAAQADCGAEPKVTWLYVDTTDAGTDTAPALPAPFTQSHEAYLKGLGATGPFAADYDGGYEGEQGAKAIVDLSRHFDWRRGACRSIFYASDEKLDSINKTIADSRAAADSAIAAAQAAGVTVFTHFVENGNSQGFSAADYAAISQHYKDLATQTGGRAQIGGVPSTSLYVDLLRDAVCKGCGESKCSTAEIPDLQPCIHASWGDSDCDCVESDDHEVVCVTICNCYSNVTFANLQIQFAVVVDGDGSAVALLPDGTPSVQIFPVGPVCFGDIGPCVDGKETCVSRQFVLLNRGAKAGKYTLRLAGVCFDLVHHYFIQGAGFDFEICKD